MGREALVPQGAGKSYSTHLVFSLRPLAGLFRWGVLLVAILAIATVFLFPNYREFPMDDAYIHFVYAHNLADQGGLFFNNPDDLGLGATSLMWVLILAAGAKTGLSVHFLAKFLGLVSLAVVSSAVFQLVRPVLSPGASLLTACLIAFSGNLLWFAVSGMETMLFLAIGCLALLVYRYERWGLLGFLLGILTLTRPEGMVLGIAIAILELLRNRKITRGILYSGVLALMICLPWFLYMQWRTGDFLPTSATGKMFTNQVAIEYAVGQTGVLSALGSFQALIYIILWITYLVEFGLGGAALPGPHLPVGSWVGFEEYTISIWAIAGLGVFLVVLYQCYNRLVKPGRWADRLRSPRLRPLLVFLLWVILHNLTYMAFLPLPGTASRYGAVNYLALWMAVAAGLDSFPAKSWKQTWLGAAVIVVVASNTLYWNQVYDANLVHMQDVRIQAANYLRNSQPPAVKCAASDIGAIRYFSEQPVLDLGALVNPEAKDWYLRGAIDRYLLENGIGCLVIPGRAGTREEGWLDVTGILGLSDSSLIDLEQSAVFEIDRETWLRGYLPTHNYQASVVVYRVVDRKADDSHKNEARLSGKASPKAAALAIGA